MKIQLTKNKMYLNNRKMGKKSSPLPAYGRRKSHYNYTQVIGIINTVVVFPSI